MENIHLYNFSEYIGLFGYAGIFLFFVTIDQITFVPEEITLLTIGYLSSINIFNPFIAGLISIAAFITVDTVYFFLSKKGIKLATRLHEKIGKNLTKFENRLRNQFPKTLLILCFIPRMRMWAPIISGTLDISIKKFLIYDAASLALFTTVYISLGMIFHAGLRSLMSELESLQHIVFGILMLMAGLGIFIVFRKRSAKES